MKRVLVFLLVFISFLGCKNQVKKEVDNTNKDKLVLIKGEFVYYADAAILKTNKEVYGVVLNKKTDELNKLAKPFKKEFTDFVLVEIKGKIVPKLKDEEGWDNLVEIKEILSVSALKTENEKAVNLDAK